MSGLWVWASVLDAHGQNDDGFEKSPLFMEMREAARHEATVDEPADYHVHEGAPRLAIKAVVNHRAAAD
jgi:hypothetical protein